MWKKFVEWAKAIWDGIGHADQGWSLYQFYLLYGSSSVMGYLGYVEWLSWPVAITLGFAFFTIALVFDNARLNRKQFLKSGKNKVVQSGFFVEFNADLD